MEQKLKIYIKENSVCSELIFRDWKTFLDVLFSCGGAVQEILWFEYVPIDKQEQSLGGGGYIDPCNPSCMWAETIFYDKNLKQKSLSELINHIEQTMNAHLPHKLVPCFFQIVK